MKIPKPSMKKKKKVKKIKAEKWVCPNCPRGSDTKYPQDTIGQKKIILEHLWGDRVFERDKGTCQKSGKKTNVSPHHIFGKKAYPGGRFNVENGILLGYAEHIHFAHGNPYAFRQFMIECKGLEWWDRLHDTVMEKQQFRSSDFQRIKEQLCTQPVAT
jgi:hypothetical protein